MRIQIEGVYSICQLPRIHQGDSLVVVACGQGMSDFIKSLKSISRKGTRVVAVTGMLQQRTKESLTFDLAQLPLTQTSNPTVPLHCIPSSSNDTMKLIKLADIHFL